MASFTDKGNAFGFVDKRAGRGTSASVVATPANYASVGALETRLLALGVAQARINQMTENDMVYAVRLADDAAGVR